MCIFISAGKRKYTIVDELKWMGSGCLEALNRVILMLNSVWVVVPDRTKITLHEEDDEKAGGK